MFNFLECYWKIRNIFCDLTEKLGVGMRAFSVGVSKFSAVTMNTLEVLIQKLICPKRDGCLF